MNKASVVHIREKYDVYIGRPSLFGNPFSSNKDSTASVIVSSRNESITRFKSWLLGTTDPQLEQDKRNALLDYLPSLKGKVLGCYCKPEKSCHGDILVELINRNLSKEIPDVF